MRILVFCSAQDVPKKYMDAAAEFATLLAKEGHTLVWGGSDGGTMHVVAATAQAAGGKIVGITTEYFQHLAFKTADEMIVTKDIGVRKQVMFDNADAVIALPGGVGTLDEASNALALQRQGDISMPVAFLNTDGFYDHLEKLFERMEKEGFFGDRDHDVVEGLSVYFADTPRAALDYLVKTAKVGA